MNCALYIKAVILRKKLSIYSNELEKTLVHKRIIVVYEQCLNKKNSPNHASTSHPSKDLGILRGSIWKASLYCIVRTDAN